MVPQGMYQYCHFTNVGRDYTEAMVDVRAEWERIADKFDVPYFPHVSIGWDNNPRFKGFRPGVVKNNTPQEFEKALKKAKEYADTYHNAKYKGWIVPYYYDDDIFVL